MAELRLGIYKLIRDQPLRVNGRDFMYSGLAVARRERSNLWAVYIANEHGKRLVRGRRRAQNWVMENRNA